MFRTQRTICIIAIALIPVAAHAGLAGYDGECKQVIDRALAQYRAATTYQDSLTVTKAILRDGAKNPEPGGPAKTIECAFAAPNKLALQGPFISVHCDGKTYWEYMRQERQYTVRDARMALAIDKMDLGMVTMNRSHPILALFALRQKPVEELLGFVRELTRVTSESLDGQPGKRLAGRLEMKYVPINDKAVDFDAWFSDATGLLGEVRLDLSAVVRQVEPIQGMTEKDRFLYVLRFDHARLNEAIPPERFVFAPQGGDMLTEATEAPLSPAQKALIGKAAPSLTCKDMSGNAANLEQLKNRVVLLYFWCTTCRACIRQLPEMQQLADANAGKPVSVVAVNSDADDSRERVASFLKDLNLKLPQWRDPSGHIGSQYGLSVLPHAVLIDTKGIVRAVYPGQIPADGLSQQISKLLP